jgi:predicted NAD-dependent protein-ADP-ribosyltransferase YbiA (DUF1768 family)
MISHSPNIIAFRKIDEPHGWLSSMSAHPIRHPMVSGGVLYPTAEHFFQCHRFSDQEIRNAILSKKSPMACKMIARRHKERMIIQPRSSEDLGLMRQTIRLKLENHPSLKKKLDALPKDCIIVEDASRRGGASALFWGMKLIDNVWVGDNWLGKLWMEVKVNSYLK